MGGQDEESRRKGWLMCCTGESVCALCVCVCVDAGGCGRCCELSYVSRASSVSWVAGKHQNHGRRDMCALLQKKKGCPFFFLHLLSGFDDELVRGQGGGGGVVQQ